MMQLDRNDRILIVSYEYYKTGYLLNTPGIDPDSFDIKSLFCSRE
jgi:hypothetical protein